MPNPVRPVRDDNTAALHGLLKIILETVKESGVMGCPSGPMYMAFMTKGYTLDQYETMTGALTDAGFIRKTGHVFYWIKDLPS